MVKTYSLFLFIIIFNFETVLYFVQGRPQFKVPLDTISKVAQTLSNTTASYIKKLSYNASNYEKNNFNGNNNNNKTKTRILFRGDLMTDFGEQDIIFPDTYQVIFENIPRINGPPKCADASTFCEDLESYPYQQLKDILKRKHVHKDLFGKDEPLDEKYTITNRNSNIESFVCGSIQRTIFPKVGKNKSNKWKYIINQDERDGYIQGIRIEVCRKEGSPCDLIGDISNGYITSCKQKYMLRRLMSLSDNGDPVQDTFQLPSACCCSYRKDLSFLSRFGEADISARSKSKEKLQ